MASIAGDIDTLDTTDIWQKYNVEINPKAGLEPLDHLINYNKTALGAFRNLQLVDKVCKVFSEVLSTWSTNTATFFAKASRNFGAGWAALSLPRLPALTKDAWVELNNWGQGRNPVWGHCNSISIVTETLAMWGYTIGLFYRSALVGNIADIAGLASDAAELETIVEDFSGWERDCAQIEAECEQLENATANPTNALCPA